MGRPGQASLIEGQGKEKIHQAALTPETKQWKNPDMAAVMMNTTPEVSVQEKNCRQENHQEAHPSYQGRSRQDEVLFRQAGVSSRKAGELKVPKERN